MNGYEVETDIMRGHARKLDAIAADVSEAAEAGGISTLDVHAFGVMCSFMVPSATALQGGTSLAITGLATSIEATSVGIKAIATGYDAIDEAVGGLLTKLLGNIPTD